MAFITLLLAKAESHFTTIDSPSMGQVSPSLTRQFSLQELPFYSVKLFPQRMDMAILGDGHTLVKCNISCFSGSLHQ